MTIQAECITFHINNQSQEPIAIPTIGVSKYTDSIVQVQH